MNHRLIAGLFVIISVCVAAFAFAAGAPLEVLAITGDSVPDGVLAEVGHPSVVSSRLAVFQADVDIGRFDDPSAILLHRSGGLERVVIEPHVMPGGSYELQTVRTANQTEPSANSSGDVLFSARFGPVGGGNFSNEGLFLFDGGTRAIVPIVRDGDPTADGNGRIDVELTNHPALNEAGQVAFWAEIYGAVGGLGNGSGIFRGSGGALKRIVRTGQIPPDGSGFFDGFSWPSMNDQGDVAFLGIIASSAAGEEGIFRGNGNQLVQIAREGEEPVPGWEIRDFTPVGGVRVNSQKKVAFRARIVDPNTYAIFAGNGTTVELLAYGGQPLERGTRNIPFTINRNLAFNDRGQVAFMAQYANSVSGLFRAGTGGLVTIALDGDPVPETVSGTFTWISGYDFALNEHGDVAFEARFQNGGVRQDGLFVYYDAFGLVPVVQEGTLLAGGVVDGFSLVGTNPSEFRSGEPSGLDDDGNVVFRFSLADGRDGIAVFRSPTVVFQDGFESGNTSAWSQTF